MEAVLPKALKNVEHLVSDLKTGKDTGKKIIEAHMRLAMSIVAPVARKHPRFRADLESEALYAITYAVTQVSSGKLQLDGDNITPLISAYIRGRLKRFLAQSHLIAIPATTISKMRKNGVEIKFDKVTCVPIEAKAKHWMLSLEFREIFDLSISTELERSIVTMKLEGYTLAEISEKHQVSVMVAHRLFSKFRNKFKDYWNGTTSGDDRVCKTRLQNQQVLPEQPLSDRSEDGTVLPGSSDAGTLLEALESI
jgi:hypothetical protein